jgi:CBS domain containing-hemolysin-like protein
VDESFFGFRLILVVLLIAINGFFAGSEVALLSVRHSRLREMAADGRAGAQAALNLLAHPERLLSVTQVGVTLTSLGLGWAGEETLYEIFLYLFHPLITPVTSTLLHGAALILAFLLISYFHVVIGEVVPKNVAIENADHMAVLVAPALLVFYRISEIFVLVIEKSAAFVTQLLIGKGRPRGGGHSTEELKLVVSSSRGMGFLPEAQEDMIHGVLDLDSLAVREIMVPRNDIVSVPVDAGLDQVLHTMIGQQHSRLPVYEGKAEHIIGVLHYKDLLPVWEERRNAIRAGRPSRAFRVRSLMRKILVVPETKPLAQMLEEFKQGRSHLAVVVDEFGTIVGLVTVEDVLEQIVGAIHDEYDEKAEQEPVLVTSDQVELDGATRIRDLETDYDIELPTEGGFETLAGFVLYELGDIPRPGDVVEHGGRRFTVLEMERNRIARVRMEKLSPQPPAATPPTDSQIRLT